MSGQKIIEGLQEAVAFGRSMTPSNAKGGAVEAVARAIHAAEADAFGNPCDWDALSTPVRERYLSYARAAIEAMPDPSTLTGARVIWDDGYEAGKANAIEAMRAAPVEAALSGWIASERIDYSTSPARDVDFDAWAQGYEACLRVLESATPALAMRAAQPAAAQPAAAPCPECTGLTAHTPLCSRRTK